MAELHDYVRKHYPHLNDREVEAVVQTVYPEEHTTTVHTAGEKMAYRQGAVNTLKILFPRKGREMSRAMAGARMYAKGLEPVGQ